MQNGRLLLTLWLCLMAGIAQAEAPLPVQAPVPIQVPVQVPTTLRVIDGDRWLELDQTSRIDIPASLLALQLTARQQRQIRRILAAAHPGDDRRKALDAYVSICRVLDRRQQRALQSRSQMRSAILTQTWSVNRPAVVGLPRTDRDNGSGG